MSHTIYSNIANLGDNLWITAAAEKLDCQVSMVDHPRSRGIAQIFSGFCNVEFNNTENRPSQKSGRGHEAQKICQAFGLNIPYCPKVIVPEGVEFHKALDTLKKIEEEGKPFVVINTKSSGGNDPNNDRAKYVDPTLESLQYIVDELKHKYTFLQFPIKDGWYDNGYTSFYPLQQTKLIHCESLLEKICYYNIIGKYIGGDTGDYHLMLATGGTCSVLIPDQNHYYSYEELLYTDDAFEGLNRVKYFNKKDYTRLCEDFK